MPLHAEPPAESTLYLSITVNHYLYDGLWPIRVDNGALWMSAEDAVRLGISAPKANASWINLSTAKHIQVNYDSLQQQLALTLPESELTHVQHLDAQPNHARDALPQAEEMGNLTLDY